jgi:hypothetical protein
MQFKRAPWLAILAGLALSLAGCTSDSPTGSSSGTVSVFLTDAPLDLAGVSAVNVTVAEVMLYPAEDDSEDAPGIRLELLPAEGAETVRINLLDYRDGEVLLLASETVPEGDYRRIRMEVLEAGIVRDDDGDPDTPEIEEEVHVPSSKVDVPVTFTVSAGDAEEIVLDFDAEVSIQVNTTQGTYPYILRPVINVVQ